MSFFDEIAAPRRMNFLSLLRLRRAARSTQKALRQKDWIDRRPEWEQSNRHPT